MADLIMVDFKHRARVEPDEREETLLEAAAAFVGVCAFLGGFFIVGAMLAEVAR